MKAKETVEWMINESFRLRPDAIVNVFEKGRMIAVIDKETWEDDKMFIEQRKEFRKREAPATFEMGDIPIIGTVFNIKL